MVTKKRFLTMVSSMLLGALPLGTRAFAQSSAADDPTSAAAAAATAQQYRDQANWLKQQGGLGYKTGLVQRAEADAAKYDDIAAGLRAPEGPPPLTPEAQHYTELADQYRAMGGAGYKTGLVQRAEADARRAQETAEAIPPTPASEVPCDVTKPAVDVGSECTGPE